MPRLRLMTWNVLYGVVASPLGPWSVRGPHARDVIIEAAPDILALQEIDVSQLAFVREGVPGYAALVGEPSGVSSYPAHVRWVGYALIALAAVLAWTHAPAWVTAWACALGAALPLAMFGLEKYRGPFRAPGEHAPILYRPDRVRPLDDLTHWISETPDVPGSAFPLLFEPRLIRSARFELIDGGATVLVVAVHFGHAPWHYVNTARLTLALIASRRISADEPVFVLGDFNASPATGVYRRLTLPRGPLTDARRAAPSREGPTTTFQWNLRKGAPPLDLDHVLCEGPVRPLRAQVLTPRPEGRTITDHDPVVVDFELDGRAL